MKAWSKITISNYLYIDLQKKGNLKNFEDHIFNNLKKVLLQKIPAGVTLPNDWESKVDFCRDKEDDGSMTYHALLYIPENSPTKLVR